MNGVSCAVGAEVFEGGQLVQRCYIRAMTARIKLQKISGPDPQAVWRQDELTGVELPVVK
jgi:hypothetical protein